MTYPDTIYAALSKSIQNGEDPILLGDSVTRTEVPCMMTSEPSSTPASLSDSAYTHLSCAMESTPTLANLSVNLILEEHTQAAEVVASKTFVVETVGPQDDSLTPAAPKTASVHILTHDEDNLHSDHPANGSEDQETNMPPSQSTFTAAASCTTSANRNVGCMSTSSEKSPCYFLQFPAEEFVEGDSSLSVIPEPLDDSDFPEKPDNQSHTFIMVSACESSNTPLTVKHDRPLSLTSTASFNAPGTSASTREIYSQTVVEKTRDPYNASSEGWSDPAVSVPACPERCEFSEPLLSASDTLPSTLSAASDETLLIMDVNSSAVSIPSQTGGLAFTLIDADGTQQSLVNSADCFNSSKGPPLGMAVEDSYAPPYMLAASREKDLNTVDMEVDTSTALVTHPCQEAIDIESTPYNPPQIRAQALAAPVEHHPYCSREPVMSGIADPEGARPSLGATGLSLDAGLSVKPVEPLEETALPVVEVLVVHENGIVQPNLNGQSGQSLRALSEEAEDCIDTDTTGFSLAVPVNDFGLFSNELPPSSPPASQNPACAPFCAASDDEPFWTASIGYVEVVPVFDQETAEEHDMSPSSPPLSSSPIPSSSPPRIFSSSPSRELFDTPPSSSPPPFYDMDQDDKDACTTKVQDKLTKRSRSTEDPFDSLYLQRGGISTNNVESQNKRLKPDAELSPPRAPDPKRPTLASHLLQRKKLAAPFRSPVVDHAMVRQGVGAVYASGKPPLDLRSAAAKKSKADVSRDESSFAGDGKGFAVLKKDYSANVAKQFKSPLSVGTSSSAPSAAPGVITFSSVKATPTIQALQGKLQTLKQAVRMKTTGGDKGDDELEELVTKWITAGREVAWAVWDTVKDADPGESALLKGKGGWPDDDVGPRGAKREGFDAGWGFDKAGGSWGWDDDKVDGREMVEEHEEEPEAPRHTLGTMLRHLGIDPQTLGWDEEEGDFVDAD